MRTRTWWSGAAVVLGLGLALGAVLGATATGEFRCVLCGHQGDEGEPVFSVKDLVEQRTKTLCKNCADLRPVCFLCSLPIPSDARDLLDGRFLCPRDAAVAVLDEAQGQAIGAEARRAMERALSRFITLPAEGLGFVLEDQKAMGRAAGQGGRGCAYPYLRVSGGKGAAGAGTYTVGLLSGQPRSWLALEAVHGLAHVWLAENVRPGRKLDPHAAEAFCDLAAWVTAEELGLTEERGRLEASRVADDQLPLFLAAYRAYDFNVVLEWVRGGQGGRLVASEPDRIRVLDARLVPLTRSEAQVIPPVPAVVERSDRLVLSGIVGTGEKRLALVNGTTLARGEKGRVRLALGVMEVRCVEIRAESVLLEIVATGERVELKLEEAK